MTEHPTHPDPPLREHLAAQFLAISRTGPGVCALIGKSSLHSYVTLAEGIIGLQGRMLTNDTKDLDRLGRENHTLHGLLDQAVAAHDRGDAGAFDVLRQTLDRLS